MRSSRILLSAKDRRTPDLDDWHTNHLDRLPGLKFMRTLWVCDISGGPIMFNATKPGSSPLGLEGAHRDLHITSDEFDEVAAELGRTLDHFRVPACEKDSRPSRHTKGK
jgi:hemoglobin